MIRVQLHIHILPTTNLFVMTVEKRSRRRRSTTGKGNGRSRTPSVNIIERQYVGGTFREYYETAAQVKIEGKNANKYATTENNTRAHVLFVFQQ